VRQLLNPFKKPNGDAEQTLWQQLTQPTDREYEEAESVVSEARQFKDWQGQLYHRRFIDWLRSNSEAPVGIGDHLSMVSGATRSNTFREVLQHLRELDHRAVLALGDDE